MECKQNKTIKKKRKLNRARGKKRGDCAVVVILLVEIFQAEQEINTATDQREPRGIPQATKQLFFQGSSQCGTQQGRDCSPLRGTPGSMLSNQNEMK